MRIRTVLARLLTVAALGMGLVGSAASLALGITPGASTLPTHVEPDGYSAPGPHPVGLMTTSTPEGTDIHVWYPASAPPRGAITYSNSLKVTGRPFALGTYEGRAGRNVSPDALAGRHPMVILSPGFAIGVASYGWLAEHLASYGFVVAGVDHRERLDPGLLWRSTITRPADVESAIVYLAGAGSPVSQIADTENVGVVGHSYGGYTALAAIGARLDLVKMSESCGTARIQGDPVVFQCDTLLPNVEAMAALTGLDRIPSGRWPAAIDDPVDAAVALAPDAIMLGRDGLADVDAPLLVIGGTADTDSPFRWGAGLAYESVASKRRIEVALGGAEHLIFTGPCESSRRVLQWVPNGLCDDPVWERADAHAVTRSYSTAFLLAELQGDRAAASRLTRLQPDTRVSVRHDGYR